ncbi:MAG: AMP-binding protein, partial [Desulfobacteraceae bacterium]|nr:AMP-binding protein [Desulfobacteraceae bacterium]
MSKLLWKPSEERIKQTNMYRFMQHVNQKFGKNLADYPQLHQWSVENIADFWSTLWDFAGVRASKRWEQVIDDPYKMPGAKWFSGARLNFAENLLRYRDDQVALIFKGEGMPSTKITYRELYTEVSQVAKSLKALGIKPGDRVVGFMPNMP